MKGFLLLLTAFCLSVTFANSAFGLDGALYTYVDRVINVRDKRDIEQPTTEPPLDLTTPSHITAEYANETDPENHIYYLANYANEEMWIDMENLTDVTTVSDRLSSSSRHAVRVQLQFRFPFYGYETAFLHVTSGGFLYAGTYPHSYLAATQYIAPLMANFNPSVDPGSTISYYGTDSYFVAEWKNLRLQDDQSGKNFTFQALIFKNGTLVFSYKDTKLDWFGTNIALLSDAGYMMETEELTLPMRIEDIPTTQHPVKVGLSDAYYHDTWIITGLISRRTIYLYHATMLDFDKVDESSTVILTPQETCTSRRTCSECTVNPPENFKCVWCNLLQRCSDGFDRNRQDWWESGCIEHNVTVCEVKPTTQRPPDDTSSTGRLPTSSSSSVPTVSSAPTKVKNICPEDCGKGHCLDYKCVCPEGYYGRTCQLTKNSEKVHGKAKSHAGLILFMLVLIGIVVVIAGWIGYAYRNPSSPSGLYLIKITRCYYFKNNGGSSHSYRYEKTAESI